MKTSRKSLLAVLLGLSFAGSATAADFTVTVEPNYPAAQAQAVYKPLLDYLSKATGQHFVLKTAGNYHVYWRDLRSGEPTDFAFEEAHFTDYRINHQRFTPLARVADPTRYVLLVDGSNQDGGANGHQCGDQYDAGRAEAVQQRNQDQAAGGGAGQVRGVDRVDA